MGIISHVIEFINAIILKSIFFPNKTDVVPYGGPHILVWPCISAFRYAILIAKSIRIIFPYLLASDEHSSGGGAQW